MDPVTAYLVRRVLALLPVMAVVVTVVFLLIHLIPGDPVSVMLGPDATPAQVEETRRALGLDRPLHEQLFLFYSRVLRGDLGRSYFLDRPVTTALWERAEPTLVLTVSALLVAVAIGVPSGIVAAAYPGSAWDRVLMTGALLGVCIPGFWLGLNFIYLFAVRLGWLPAAGYASLFVDPVAALRYMVLPAVSLGFNQSALIARIARSCMLEVLQQDYIRTARAKGLPQRLVVYVHAFRNALVPVVAVIGITMAILIGGAVVTEIVFNIPGLGRLIISAILRRDYPVVQGVVLVTATAYVLINLAVDVVYALIDPRIRYE
jgi:peptide/nickel transport system permease protein